MRFYFREVSISCLNSCSTGSQKITTTTIRIPTGSPRYFDATATVRSGPTVSGPISAAGRLRPPSLPPGPGPAPFSGAAASVTTLAGSSEGSSSWRV